MEVLKLLNTMKNVDLKSILLCKSIYKTFYAVLNHAINPAAVFLTWAAFPRLLLVFPGSIHPPSIFQKPDWLQNWHSILLELETGAKKFDDYNKIVISDSSKEDFWYKFDTLLCEVHGVSEAGALLLANILCTNTRLILEHDDDCGKVRLWSGWSRKPADGFMKKKIAYMMMLVVEKTACGGGGGGAEKAACHPRTATPEEVNYLRQLRLSVRGCCYHVNWEHYCCELLQGIKTVAARPIRNITELRNVDYSQPMGDLCVVTGVDRPAARLLATALCSSTIIVVHDNLSTVWVKDITRSGPGISDSRRTTYRILPLGYDETTTTTTTTTK